MRCSPIPAIEIILNLTVPKAHVEVGLQAIAAGKHVYSEKPLGVALQGRQEAGRARREEGLRVGSAPDTFLGGAHQTCRRLIDAGKIGEPVGGTAYFMCPGHERWHPAPDFYYQAGGGPILDMAPYYLTDLVNLLGPVARVAAMTSMPKKDAHDHLASRAPVRRSRCEVATHAAGTLRVRLRRDGAALHELRRAGAPASADRDLRLRRARSSCPIRTGSAARSNSPPTKDKWQKLKTELPYADANYRSIGLADMAHAIRSEPAAPGERRRWRCMCSR